MICVSIAERGYAACMRALRGVQLAEIRLDLCGLGERDTVRLFSAARKRLVATCRPGRPDSGKLLLAAIGAGAAFVDVELGAPSAYRREIIRRAGEKGCTVIISHHDYRKTPGRAELKRIVRRCFAAGAGIAKIACMARSADDSARLLGLARKDIIVIGMGPRGRITRVAAPLLGSPFTFASSGRGRETAAGQMTKGELERIYRLLGAKRPGRNTGQDTGGAGRV